MKAFFVISFKGSLCNLLKYTLVYARCVFYSPVHKEKGEFHCFSVRYRDFAAQIVHNYCYFVQHVFHFVVSR